MAVKKEFKIRNINITEIHYHRNLQIANIEKLKTLFNNVDLNLVKTFYPPFVVETPKGFSLLGRHWVLALIIAKNPRLSGKASEEAYNIPVIVVDPASVEQILELDRLEIEFFLKFNTPNKASRSTLNRLKSRKAGRICPFCHGVLRRPRDKADRTKEVGYIIHCENNTKTSTGRKCDFELILTDIEYNLFINYKLPISKILVPISKNCPKCGNRLYKRIVHKSDEIRIYERCRNKISSNGGCDYNTFIKNIIEK
jgi:hypothetical protein